MVRLVLRFGFTKVRFFLRRKLQKGVFSNVNA
jgi:hypothetical protein